MDNLLAKLGVYVGVMVGTTACGSGDGSDTTGGTGGTTSAESGQPTTTVDDVTGTSESSSGGVATCEGQPTIEECMATVSEFGCHWLPIVEVTIAGDGACEFNPTGDGICTSGFENGDTTGCPETYCDEGNVYQRTLDDGTVVQVTASGGCSGASGPGAPWLLCGAQATCECGCTEDAATTSTS